MAIVCNTYCKDCAHLSVCKYVDNAGKDADKLASMTYGDGPNDDYDWQTMSEVNHVNITFSCPHYYKEDQSWIL